MSSPKEKRGGKFLPFERVENWRAPKKLGFFFFGRHTGCHSSPTTIHASFRFKMITLAQIVIYIYLAIELNFVWVFYLVLVPKANQLNPKPPEYRDYGRDRKRLLQRILARIEATCKIHNDDPKEAVTSFLTSWFRIQKVPPVSRQEKKNGLPTLSSLIINSDDDDDDESAESRPSCLYKEEVDKFFAWAFFAKDCSLLKKWEMRQLNKIYTELDKRLGITFPEKDVVATSIYQPRCMTLEPLRAFYRPLCVYLLIRWLKAVGSLVLFICGFHRYVSKSGQVSWYRPATKGHKAPLTTTLFFHGIAPGGLTLYLPMFLHGLASERDRAVFLFENSAISCTLNGFSPLTEQQIVDGVIERLETAGAIDENLTLVGHSFGSCTVSWLIASKQLQNVKQVVLLDPVAILLSEPDVMVNFLYGQKLDQIRLAASSELFTEYYLRRHFAWYNSELYVEDVDCPLLVCLSGQDTIVNASKVRQEMKRHENLNHNLVYWEKAGHADCVKSSSKWKQIKNIMLEQELKYVQEKS